MLEVARRKSRQEGLDIFFVNRDVRNLDRLELLPAGSKGFDVITCASALVLIQNPIEAVRHWASVLAPGGRLITDIPAERLNLVWHILTDVVLEVGQSLGWEQNWVDSKESLRRLLEEAGLVVKQVIRTEPYDVHDYDIQAGSEIFEKAIANPMFRVPGDSTVKEQAKKLFVKKLQEMAGSDGILHEEVSFYRAITLKGI